MTGLYELEREGVDLSNLISETRTEETVLGGAVALFGAATLLLPLLTGSSFEGPLAAIAAVALTTWAVDALALNGLLSRAGSLALQDGARVAYHEAGHMIIGHMLGFEVTGYTHPTARALLRGEEVGVRFENGTTSDAYSVGALGMAGVAGEVVRYGSSQGGQEDLAEVSRAVRSVGGDVKLASRWGMLAGVQILKAHPKAHEEVAAAMRAGDGVAKCLQVLETFAEGGELTPA